MHELIDMLLDGTEVLWEGLHARPKVPPDNSSTSDMTKDCSHTGALAMHLIETEGCDQSIAHAKSKSARTHQRITSDVTWKQCVARTNTAACRIG